MKQIYSMFVVMIICMQCIPLSLRGMQFLKKELQNLNNTLLTLENKLQSSSQTPPPPPPAPLYQKQAGPKFYKAKHYEYTTPNGKKVDIAFGLVTVSTDINDPAYSFIMYGPQLKKNPNEQTFNTILFGIREESGKDILTFYPDIADENLKTEYIIIDGFDELKKKRSETILNNTFNLLDAQYEILQNKFNDNFQRERAAGPDNEQKGSIFGTSYDEDKEYVQELVSFFNSIEINENSFKEIKNLSYFDTFLIPTLNKYFNLIKNFKDKVDKFTNFFTSQSSLGRMITNKKFGIDQFSSRKVKDEKAKEYSDTIQKPIAEIVENFDNLLNNTVKAQQELLRKQPMSEIRKYYNDLLSTLAPSTTTPTRDITQALQEKVKKRPQSAYEPKTVFERAKELQEQKEQEEGLGAEEEEWED